MGRLVEILCAMSDPRLYEDHPSSVEVIQTHMSWLFLTSDRVYKLKKPVHSTYFDFRSLAARHRNCLDEVRLNLRLAPDVYLGVLPLTWARGEGYRINGQGFPVEWLVCMRRLPADLMLDRSIKAGTASNADIQALGRLLVNFYQQARRIPLTPQSYQRRYQLYLDEQKRELSAPQFGLPQEPLVSVCAELQDYLQHSSQMAKRAEGGRILEAHGDLRPEHVCLTKPPVIIDCLEFSEELRSLDPIDELAFFTIECEREGAGELGEQLLTFYQETTGDRVDLSLIRFYKAYRALLRAKLSIWHLNDPDEKRREHWLNRTHQYLAMASFHAHRLMV